MSWLFGYNKSGERSSLPIPEGSQNDESSKSSENKTLGYRSQPYSFDSSGLERAADAAKELEKSKFASQALELSKMQEETKQKEQMVKIKEYEITMQQMANEGKKMDAEAKREYLEQEAKIAKSKAEYQDQLARRRYEDQLGQQQRLQEDNLRKQEESVAKQEAMRKSTLEYEMELRSKADMKRISAEMEAKGRLDRENQDLYLEQIRCKAQESRSTILEGIQTAGSVLGAGASAFLADWDKVAAAAAGISLLALGVYTSKRTTSVAASYLTARLGKPSLVRDTSRFSALESLKHPISAFSKLVSGHKVGNALSGVVLEPSLEAKLRDIAIATKNTKLNKGLFRNLLFYGPPGTGKTLFAKKLAMHSGMDYAILTGGDIAPLGRDAVTAMHKVFDWASTSRKGLILFIDEADAFLRKRSSEKISEDLRSALNAFLYRTGEQNDKFMMVLASNTPEQLDWAINDRLDDMVPFSLPGLQERERLVRLYFDKYVLTPASQGPTRKGRTIRVEEMDYGELCSDIALKVKGLSGRGIAKLGVAWQASGYASEDALLTKAMILSDVQNAIASHSKKIHWLSKEEIRDESDEKVSIH